MEEIIRQVASQQEINFITCISSAKRCILSKIYSIIYVL